MDMRAWGHENIHMDMGTYGLGDMRPWGHETGTDHIWEMNDQEWQLLDVKMGARVQVVWDNALIVPSTWRAWCP